MKFRTFFVVLLFCCIGAQTLAQPAAAPLRATDVERERTVPLIEALGIEPLLEIIREEGMAHAVDLELQMFPGRGRDRWLKMVDKMYDVDRMTLIVLDEMAADMEPWHLDPLIDFFAGDLGERIVSLEVSARRAMLDPSVEEASHGYLALLRDEGGRRLELLEEFASVNDLVEMNVTGALNANFAFYTGLNNAGAFPHFRGEEDMLREIWQQESEIRLETSLWVMSYLAMAYQPLRDADLEDYIALSKTEAGRRLNVDLFEAFSEVFQTISNEMGMAAAQFMSGEEL